jgi:hypothetical protein
LHRLVLAFRGFFGILFQGKLPDGAAAELGLAPRAAAKPAAAAPPPATAADGAVLMLSILQRDSRLIDFLMEDISAYDDEQIGAAVRSMHDDCRGALARYVQLAPVIDGVEGTYTKTAGVAAAGKAELVKYIGNVPAGTPEGGTLRHKGWRAVKVDLPAPQRGADVVAPAEIEIE